MKRRTPKTQKHLKLHVKRRALERFGWELTGKELERIVDDIQAGRATFVDRQSLNVTRWKVHLRDKEVGTVFDKQRKMIRTLMPVEFLEGGGVRYDAEALD